VHGVAEQRQLTQEPVRHAWPGRHRHVHACGQQGVGVRLALGREDVVTGQQHGGRRHADEVRVQR